MENVWSCEGIPNVRWIWLDEGGMIRYQAWVNLQGRAAPREARIFTSTTPYGLNFMYHDIYRPWLEGKISDVDIIQWKSCDNPYFSQAEYLRQKDMLDPRMFAMRYEGLFTKLAGLVYQSFDRLQNAGIAPDLKRFRERYYVFAGVDWGYSNPFAIVVRIIAKDGSEDIQVDEFLRPGLAPNECVECAKRYKAKWDIEMWYCDEEAPDYIRAFNLAGLKAVGVKKGRGSVMEGIGLHNSLIKTRQHKLVMASCKNTIDEYETYSYPERDDRSVNISENPVDASNHLLSATRYLTMATQWIRVRALKEKIWKPEMKSPLAELMARSRRTKNDWVTV
jgi:phage terminase large subunit